MKKNYDEKKSTIKDGIKFTQKKFENVKEFAKDKMIPTVSSVANNAKNSVSNVSSKVVNKVKTTITEEQVIQVLDTLYIKAVNGIPKVSLPVDDLVEDYVKKNSTIEEAAKSLINNSIVKCGTSGFLTGLGGLATMAATLPANITSVMYVQLRMCCAIAMMAGYDIHSDQVQTLIYACLTGSAISDVLKHAGITFGSKFGTAMIKKIPGKTLTMINQKVGFRFVTKFGEKGIINLGKTVPILGGVIGGSVDIVSTRIIGYNTFKIFMKGELPSVDEIKKELDKEDKVIDVQVKDVDTEMIKL